MRCLWILFCLVLGGCAAYEPMPLDAAQLAAGFGQRSLADPALGAYIASQSAQAPASWPPARWDRRMLTLAAGYYNPQLAAARAQAQGAHGAIDSAGAKRNPTLDFPFEYALNHQGEGKPYTTGPGLTWTLETAGKRAARVDQAEASAAAARFKLLDAAWQVRSQVRAALLAVYANTRRSALMLDKAGDARRSVELLEHRLNVGAVALPDVRRARLLLAQIETELAATRVALADARTRLATAIGIPLAALDGVQFDVAEFEAAPVVPAPLEARRTAILHRADLHAALAEYDAAQAALRLEVARQYPDVQVNTGYVYDAGASKISFGLAGLTLPVFDRNRGGVNQAEARRSELAARAQALQAGIFNELDNALARVTAANEQRERAAIEADDAARQRASVDASFAVGAADRLELTQARIDYQVFALERLNAEVAVQEAAGLLEDAMQTDTHPTPTSSAP